MMRTSLLLVQPENVIADAELLGQFRELVTKVQTKIYERSSDPNPLRHSVLMVALHRLSDGSARDRARRRPRLSAGFRVDFSPCVAAVIRRNNRFAACMCFISIKAGIAGTSVIAYLFSYIEFFLRCTIKIVSLQIRERYSVVHVNNMPDFSFFAACCRSSWERKVVLDIHDPMANTFASKFNGGDGSWCFKLLLWQERLSAAFADRVITVHDPLKHHVLVKQHGLAAEAYRRHREFLPTTTCSCRGVLHVSDDRTSACFHGTILERYGLRNAMYSLAAMRHRDRISVTLIGEGDIQRNAQSAACYRLG
jgi:hypothetical protein